MVHYLDSLELVDLDEYINLKSPFILPATNSLIFRYEVIQLLFSITNICLYTYIPSESSVRSYNSNKTQILFPKNSPEERNMDDYTQLDINIWSWGYIQKWTNTIPVQQFGYNFYTCFQHDYRS